MTIFNVFQTFWSYVNFYMLYVFLITFGLSIMFVTDIFNDDDDDKKI